MNKIGDRVGAIQKADKNTVYLYGYGTYIGYKRPPVGLFGLPIEDMPENYTNPCIELDDGSMVWGMECWWGAEEKVKESIGDRRVTIVNKETNHDQ